MKLKDWLSDNRYTYQEFATLLEPFGVLVSHHAVQKWTIGHEPRRKARYAIQAITKGKVRPESFVKEVSPSMQKTLLT